MGTEYPPSQKRAGTRVGKAAFQPINQAPAAADEFLYDAFLSYATRTDYAIARRLESLLESVHRTRTHSPEPLRPLQICRDGSDFRLPSRKVSETEEAPDPVWEAILAELSRSRYLIVLGSPGAGASRWMAREIEWFLEHRGPEFVLLALASARDPVAHPEEAFPEPVLRAGLHHRIWYDLRGLRSREGESTIRDPEDEAVRLAADLLGWNAARHGPLAALWRREQLQARRRQASAAVVGSVLLSAAAVIAWWQASLAHREARLAHANAIVLSAAAGSDPLVGALLLREIGQREEPDGGMEVAQKLAALPRPTALLRGHGARVSFVAWAPDNRIVSAAEDGTARIWRSDGRGDPVVLRGPGRGPVKAALSEDRLAFAVADAAGAVCEWPLQNPGAGQSFSTAGKVTALRFAPGAQCLAVVREDGQVSMWDLARRDAANLRLPSGRKVIELYWKSEEDGLLAADDGDLWSFALHRSVPVQLRLISPRPPEMRDFPSSLLATACFSADGSQVVFSAKNDALVRRIDGLGPPVLVHHNSFVNSVDLNRTGTRLLTASSDGTARITQTTSGRRLRVFDSGQRYVSSTPGPGPVDVKEEPFSVQSASFSRDGTHVVTISEDGPARVWDAGGTGTGLRPSLPEEAFSGRDAARQAPWLQLVLRNEAGTVSASFDSTGTRLVTGADDGSLRIWPLSPPPEPMRLQHPAPVDGVAFSPDGTKVATGARDGIARIWPTGGGPPLELDAHAGAVRGVAFSPTLPLVATAHAGGGVYLWHLNQSAPMATQPLESYGKKVLGVRFAGDGNHLLSWSEDGTARLSQVRPGSPPITFGPVGAELSDADLTEDGSHVVIGYGDGSARLWDATGHSPGVLLGGGGAHRKIIWQVRFSPDGTHILTVSEDGTARIWPSSGRGTPVILPAAQADDGLSTGAFTPDGTHVVTASFSGRVRIWRADGKGAPQILRMYEDLAQIGVVTRTVFGRNGGRLLTTGGADGRSYVWTPGSHRPPVGFEIGGTITDGAFSPDGSRVAVSSEDQIVQISRVGWGDLVRLLQDSSAATLTPAQRTMLLGESEPDARRRYEDSERRYGRTPARERAEFQYPSW